VLAERYDDLGLDNSALALEQRALADRRRVLGEEHPDTLLSMANVGEYLSAVGKKMRRKSLPTRPWKKAAACAEMTIRKR
jgi:hypothetical protein